ncbi:MAG: mechanosensitive ion channel family protein [Acidimicrobiales bacterium]
MARRGFDLSTPVRGRDWCIAASELALAIAAVVVGTQIGQIHSHATHLVLIAWLCALVLVAAGSLAVQKTTATVGRAITQRSYPAAGAIVRLVATGVGYIILFLALFGVLGVSLQHLLIGAGVAGVIIGIAAQQSLANVFAALVLLFARPFVVGDRIRIRSGVLGVIDVDVLGIGLTYVTVRTDDGVLKVPNSLLLASGVGHFDPQAPPASES